MNPRDDESLAATTPYGDKGPPTASAGLTFSPGETIAGRYRIVRFIAQGGMGEVHEAEDLELRTHVALKTIRPEIAADPAMMERFKREIHLAHKVTHPNVSRIFDLGFHRDGTKSVTFLTMELLPGETLAARVSAAGRLAPEEAFPIVAQMAAALDAAHEAGIVHRDFKSGNVILVDTEKGVRAVVTDFGLARGSAGKDGFAASMTGTGTAAGTPLYMAPEQVEGSEVTGAADIYALGVVMYEMVTGKWPFMGDSPISIAVKHLKEKPPSPRTHVVDLDKKWEVAILRCLERDPANRFGKATDVVRALGGENVRAGRRQRRLALATIAALVLLAGGFGYYLARGPRSGLRAAVKARRSVAVLGFKNLAGRPEEAWLSTALSEMLTTELSAGEKLRTVPGETIAKMKISLALPETDSFAKETLGRIRENIDAGYVVLGSYLALGNQSGGQVRLDLRLQDAAAGETVATVTESGTEAQIAELVSRAGARLREKLGAGEVSSAEAASVRASLPSNPEAARLYAEGLQKLRIFDNLAARDLLEKAVAADPRHALSHAALAEAWTNLGYDAKAQEAARKAFEFSSSLSRNDRLWVEGRYRETTREWERAIACYRSLFAAAPDNLEYGLRLVDVQGFAPKQKSDIAATIVALRRLPSPSGDDPRIDLAEASAFSLRGDSRREEEAAAKSAARARARGARLQEAAALMLQSEAVFQLGRYSEAMNLARESRRIYAQVGDRLGEVKAIFGIELVLQAQGQLREARAMIEQHIATLREIGNATWVPGSLVNLSFIAGLQGDVAAERRASEESLSGYRGLNMKLGEVYAGTNLIDALARQANVAKAAEIAEHLLPIARESGDQNAISGALSAHGWVLSLQGNLEGARTATEEALSFSRKINATADISSLLSARGDLLKHGDRLSEARKDYEEALRIQTEAGEKGRMAETRFALAKLSIEEGHAADAQAPLREAREVFREQGRLGDEIDADTALAETLLAQGRTLEARKEIDAAVTGLEKSLDRTLRIRADIVSSRVRAAEGHGAEAIRALEATLAEATKAGFVPHQLEARLALGEIEIQSGRTAAGRARLEALEKDARAKGFLLIARKAAAAGG